MMVPVPSLTISAVAKTADGKVVCLAYPSDEQRSKEDDRYP